MAKAKVAIQVIEVEKLVGVPDMDAGGAQAVAGLEHHPGMQYLLASLRFQAAALKSALYKNRHKDLKDVEFLQSGINWAGWLQAQIERAVGITKTPQVRAARPAELDKFEQLLSQIDVVGASQSGDNA